jgi:4-hydroxy-tetrahydrodipicolinate reductase
VRIAIAGSSGRMGRMIIAAALAAPDVAIAAALDRPGSPDIGRDCGEFLGRETGVRVTERLDAIAAADVLIDFTQPQATLAHLQACLAHRVAMAVGTTGFDAAGKEALQRASASIALVVAPNMSLGVQVLLRLVEEAARLLDPSYDLEILEFHHRHKVDAPSGTALQLGETAARARGQALEDGAIFARHGQTGARPTGSIGFAALRGGDVVGEHSVIFAGAGERIEITHRSSSRESYAAGALRAARFLAGRAPGLYGMQDVLA